MLAHAVYMRHLRTDNVTYVPELDSSVGPAKKCAADRDDETVTNHSPPGWNIVFQCQQNVGPELGVDRYILFWRKHQNRCRPVAAGGPELVLVIWTVLEL